MIAGTIKGTSHVKTVKATKHPHPLFNNGKYEKAQEGTEKPGSKSAWRPSGSMSPAFKFRLGGQQMGAAKRLITNICEVVTRLLQG